MRLRKLLVVYFLVFVSGAFAQDASRPAAGIQYSISLANVSNHLLRVEMHIPPGADERVVRMPVWNALYQVRDFAQYIEAISAQDGGGGPLRLTQSETSAWRVAGAANGAVVSYDIYADNPGPYGAQADEHHAFLNLAQVLLYEDGMGRNSKLAAHFNEIPLGWTVATAISWADVEFGRNRDVMLLADSYDQLVDSPIEFGVLRIIKFKDDNTDYQIAVDANSAEYDAAVIESSVRRIVRAETEWMKDQPCSRYVFIYHFPRGQGGGGMEHACSTAIDVPAERMADSSAFDAVTAHEFFHLWNVKRIRPRSLEPVDYTKEQDTRVLWFSEGVTSTVQEIVLLRAGLITKAEYLRRLSEEIDALQHRPAHRFQTAEESSLEAWLEKYPFYRRPERSVSYYNKGEILGAMLDLAVRDATGGKKSLRDVFLWMNQHYAQKGVFFDDSEGVRAAVEAVSGKDFGDFFRDYVAGTLEIPYDSFLRSAGLRMSEQRVAVADPGFTTSRNFDAASTVLAVTPGSEAEGAGLKAGDVIVSVNDKTSIGDAIASLQPGDAVRLRVRSRRRERELKFKAARIEISRFSIIEMEKPTAEQLKRREEWLETSSAGAAAAGGSR